MADFQIIESQRTLPSTGTGAVAHPQVGTGYDKLLGIIGETGAEAFNLGAKLYITQGRAELTQKMFEANETFQQLHKDLLTETNPERYSPMFDEAWQKVESAQVDNGWARQRYQESLVELKRSQANAVLRAYANRVRENIDMALANAEAQAIRTNNIKPYETLLNIQVKQGYMIGAEARFLLGNTKEKAEAKLHANTQQMMSAYAYDNPEDVLSWKTSKEMLKVFPGARPTDLTWIQGVAQNKLAIESRQQEMRISQYYGMVHKLAADSLSENPQSTSADVLRQIQNLDLTDQEKTALVKEYNNAVNIWSKSGGNPYKQTTNYTKFLEMKYDAIDGRLNEKQIRKAEGKDISISDADEIRRLIKGEGAAKAFEDTRAAKFLSELLQDYEQIGYVDKVKIEILREKGYRFLQDAIDKADPPMSDREKKGKALSIYNSLIKELPGLTTEPSELLTPEDIAKRNKYFVGRGLTPGEFAGTKPANITKTATNPKTGERVGWDGEKWIKL